MGWGRERQGRGETGIEERQGCGETGMGETWMGRETGMGRREGLVKLENQTNCNGKAKRCPGPGVVDH